LLHIRSRRARFRVGRHLLTSSLEIETEPTRRLFSGLCQVILQTYPGKTGKARLVAQSDGVRPAKLDSRWSKNSRSTGEH